MSATYQERIWNTDKWAKPWRPARAETIPAPVLELLDPLTTESVSLNHANGVTTEYRRTKP